MRIFSKTLILVWVAAISQNVNAQSEFSESNTGSYYSLFGIGLPVDNTTARETGLGILGVSLDNSESNSLQNPAFWGSNSFTTASTGFTLSQINAKNATQNSSNSLIETGYVQITFPVFRQKLGLSASLYPVTKSTFRIFSDDIQVTESDTIGYFTNLKGTGGVNKLEVGLGWRISENISVGYAPSLAFISKNNTETVFFHQAGFTSNQINSKISGYAFSHRFGALIASDIISFGTSLTLPVTIDASSKKSSTRTISNQIREVILDEGNGSINIPLEINAGLTYYPSSFVNISLEGQLQKWSDFESEIPLEYKSSEIIMQDRYRLGLGTEFHPYKFNSGKFLSKFRYTAGIAYDSGHLNIKNKNIDTFWLSAGFGILSRSRSTVDISLRYGIRGTTTNNLIQENILGVNLSINLMEFMFHRPKLN